MEKSILIFVGSYTSESESRGIYAFRLAAGGRACELLGCVATAENPSFLWVDSANARLYAVRETSSAINQEGAVLVYRIDRTKGSLEQIGQIGSGGVGPCHLSVDQRHRTLFVANYHSGSVTSISLNNDGCPVDVSSCISLSGSSAHPQRQLSSHPHAILVTPDHRFALVADLGSDRLRVFNISDTGALSPAPDLDLAFPPGFGPRRLAIHPKGRILYVIHEIACKITVHRLGGRQLISPIAQSISTHGSDTSVVGDAADLVIDSSGRRLYASTRRTSSVRCYEIDESTGHLKMIIDLPSGGTCPQALMVASALVLAANMDSNSIDIINIARDRHPIHCNGVSIPRPSALAALC